MTRNTWLLVAALIVLGAGYAYRFTDWFSPPKIQIDVVTRPSGRPGRDADSLPTLFMLDREYPIRGVRVVAVSNVPPTQLGKPVWQVSAADQPEAVRGFEYGDSFKGTKTVLAAQKLVPEGVYRVEFESGRYKGQREFHVQAPGAPAE
jgi:hypothetical protein